MQKPNLSAWQIVNMSIGFFGIQHGFEIQFARMSAIYEKLGAQPDQIPFLWLAAPMTGLIIQPIIGYMSDKTWIPGLNMRRRPYFFTGAVLATGALCLMPGSSSLWMAAGLLWVLDASLNISMEPFRAFVADKQNTAQRPAGYACQSLMIGLGTIAGNYIASINLNEKIPALARFGQDAVHLSFFACAIIFLLSVLYTVITTPEYPPEDMEAFKAASSVTPWQALKKWARETAECYFNMPPVMKRLAVVQFFTWMGLFCMWMYYSVAVAHSVFGADDPHSELYEKGIFWAAHTMMIKGLATPLFALCIPSIVKLVGRAYTHALALLLCGLGLFSLPFIKNPDLLYLPMIAAGIGWASIVAMPYVILVEHLPKNQYGIYMGMFNMFIVIPEILVSLGLGGFMMGLLQNNHAYVVAFGGVLILVAAAITPTLRRFEDAPGAARP
ncbi:MAG TPA: MFS transporter [Elusimicrobia bacterium]|nr:MFS transporter [Elusimicrobiota bacterium]HBT60743.1 MFS transporter [Elusimicrobiota bacterium]